MVQFVEDHSRRAEERDRGSHYQIQLHDPGLDHVKRRRKGRENGEASIIANKSQRGSLIYSTVLSINSDTLTSLSICVTCISLSCHISLDMITSMYSD